MSGRVAVFASGGGSNLQALIDHFRDRPGGEVVLVISDRQGAGALERAREAGIAVHVIPVQARPIAAVTADTIDALESARIDVVALAGYLRLLPPDVVRRFAYRILNIHPALLPAFGGKGMYGSNVHRAVLESGCRVSGATVHFVDEAYDQGRILAQWPVPVLDADAPEDLAERVLRVEHVLYPTAVEWLARVLAAAGGEPAGEASDDVVAAGDVAAAVRRRMPRTGAEAAHFSLSGGGGPDRAGIRGMFRLGGQ